MARKKPIKATVAEAAASKVRAFKAFNADWKCRDFQFAVGQTYTITGEVECCKHGFHACEAPFDILNHYPLIGSKFADVECGGTIHRMGDDSKIACAEISIKAEITLPSLIKRAAAWTISKATDNTATGDGGHAAATGYRGLAAATGYSGHAAATGDGAAAVATGVNGIAAALGAEGKATAGVTGWIVLAEWKRNGDKYDLIAVRSAQVDGPEGIKPDVLYTLTGGEFVEVAA